MADKNTLLVTAGRNHSGFGSVNPPTYRASTILFKDFDAFCDAYHGRVSPGYGRQGNPTTDALGDALSQLIEADHTLLTPSGLQAITTPLLAFLETGDHVLMVDSVYGPSRAFCDHVLRRMGIETTYYEPKTTPEQLRELIRDNTRVVFLEAPGSLTFEMQDIRGLCEVAHAHGCMTMLDYTWATPLYIKPFELGVDMAIQAVTKYMAGHSDVVMGAVSCREEYWERLSKTACQIGNYVTGDECSLVLRGLRTMAVRLEHQQNSVRQVMSWIAKQSEVASLLYPPLKGDTGHTLWKDQMTGGAALFAAALKPSITEAQVRAFANHLRYFGLGFSWGGYESLLVPFKPAEIRTATTKWDKDQWCLRFHIGLEAVEDLVVDLDGGFAAMRGVLHSALHK